MGAYDHIHVAGFGPRDTHGDQPAAGPVPSANGEARQGGGTAAPPHFSNYVQLPGSRDGKRGGKKACARMGFAAQEIEARLRQLTGGWPRRVGNLLFAEGSGQRPLWLERPPQLFAWVARHVPPDGQRNNLVWGEGPDLVSEARFHAYLTQTAEDFDAVELFPHWPQLPRTYYMHAPVAGGSGEALALLLSRFCPASPIDGDLLRAFFLTLAWGGLPGSRPAWLFMSDDDDAGGGRGVGKTTAAKVGARLFGGHVDLATNERMPDLITRLLTPDALERRVVLLDNVKSLKLSWGELEALITNDLISGHRMYHGEGRRPNTLTYCLTLNGAALSRDMAQRCVIVKLARPQYGATWEEDTYALVEARRWEIIGDLLAELRAPPPCRFVGHGRWGGWESAVLSRVAEPADCQRVIRERQEEVDEDASEADLVREVFLLELQRRAHRPEIEAIRIDSKTAGAWCNLALGERRNVQKASQHLGTLEVPELRRQRGRDWRGFIWRGARAPTSASPVPLRKPDDQV
jgi:hypothetical protein